MLYDNPEHGRRLGEAGRRLMRQKFSVEALEQRCLARLSDSGGM
jgi:hypothetical protein